MGWNLRIIKLLTVVVVRKSLPDVGCNALEKNIVSDPEFDLNRMYNFLYDGDKRLIRYNIPSDDALHRQQRACQKDLNNVLSLLSSSKLEADQKNKAAYIITTCTIEHPRNRNKIGTYNDGIILQSLIDMLEVGDPEQKDNINGSALAAEATWILSFNNAHNHEYFLSNGAIPALSNLVQYENANANGNENSNVSSLHHAKMWAASALQNLAASYCRTDSGHCWWEYNDNESKGLHLHSQSPLRDELGSIGRQQMLDQPGLVSYLKKITCNGPVTTAEVAATTAATPTTITHPWPSEATVEDNVTSQLTTWAMTGALRNLALHENALELLGDMKECFCDLFHSKDWLESSKADDALSRLGMSGTCTPPHYKNCVDFHEWRNEFGETCALYAENEWCDEFGHLMSKDGGVKANEACCICNGGDVNGNVNDTSTSKSEKKSEL